MKNLLWICLLALTACGGDEGSAPAAKTQPQPAVTQDHVFKTQQEALEKAKQLQSTLDKAAAEQQKQIDQQF